MSIDYLTHPDNQALSQLRQSCDELTSRHMAGLLPRSVIDMEHEERQALVDRLTPYLTFEIEQIEGLIGMPIIVTGHGLLFISDPDGTVHGAETITDHEVVTGVIREACIYPVPTYECVQLSNEYETPILDETLSGVVLLSGGRYKTGPLAGGDFEIEHDLSNFQIGIPLAHRLTLQTTRQQSAL